MLEALLLPSILAVLSYICVDKQVRSILIGWVIVYSLDVVIGGMFFSTYPSYFVYSIINSIVITSFTLLKLTEQWEKALIIMFLSYIDISVCLVEVIYQWPDWFYPHMSTISWWVIEIQLLTLIYNIQFKASRKL